MCTALKDLAQALGCLKHESAWICHVLQGGWLIKFCQSQKLEGVLTLSNTWQVYTARRKVQLSIDWTKNPSWQISL